MKSSSVLSRCFFHPIVTWKSIRKSAKKTVMYGFLCALALASGVFMIVVLVAYQKYWAAMCLFPCGVVLGVLLVQFFDWKSELQSEREYRTTTHHH